jgi:hypothetical protein
VLARAEREPESNAAAICRSWPAGSHRGACEVLARWLTRERDPRAASRAPTGGAGSRPRRAPMPSPLREFMIRRTAGSALFARALEAAGARGAVIG